MKRAIILTVSLCLITITATFAAYDRQVFLDNITDEIYDGIQSGDLTKREVKVLRNAIRSYQYKVWQLSDYGHISRNEERTIQRLERDLVDNLETLMYNRERVRRSAYPGTNRGEYYDPGYRSTTYGTRGGNRGNNRGNGTYCPPPRRRGW